MSKASYKKGITANKVFAFPMGTDKQGRTTFFRIVDKRGKTVSIAKNGLGV